MDADAVCALSCRQPDTADLWQRTRRGRVFSDAVLPAEAGGVMTPEEVFWKFAKDAADRFAPLLRALSEI